jgi:outer membrane protein assembly factor BamB
MALISSSLLVHPLAAEEWTRFRGPNGSGVSAEKGIPSEFGAKDYNWKVAIEGVGHSQPVIFAERIFVTSAPADGSERLVTCMSARDGSTLWTKRIPAKGYHTHDRNSYASSTPAVDAERVYTSFQDGDELWLFADDHSGREVWRHSLGSFGSQHGSGASPIIVGDKLIFPCEQLDGPEEAPGPSFVIALDRTSGDLIWKTPRRSLRTAYGTPCVYEAPGGRTELFFTSGACGIYSLDAASGKPLWDANVFELRAVSSPVIAAGLVFGTCGSGAGGNYLVAVRPDGKGDVRDTHVIYRLEKSMPYVPTPVALGDRLFTVSDKGGIVTCVNAGTGEQLWQERTGGDYSASPIIVDRRLFCVNHDGDVTVLGTGDRHEVLGKSSLGELCRTPPAVASGRIYFRTVSHLISVGSPEKRFED